MGTPQEDVLPEFGLSSEGPQALIEPVLKKIILTVRARADVRRINRASPYDIGPKLQLTSGHSHVFEDGCSFAGVTVSWTD
jgi:hypothetical protein